MGRSKFPGKPSKHILRKRINVLPPVAEISNVESRGSVTVETAVENNQGEDAVEGNSESSVIQNVNKKVSIKRRLTRKMKSLITSNKNQRTLLSRMCNKSSVKGKLNKGPRTSLNRKSVHNYTCRSKTTNEATNLVGKFVLPTRSVHSSRVIKPNKRFISDMNEGLSLKKKVTIAKRQCLKQEDEKSKLKSTETGSCNTESDKTTFTNGHRVVLRQARLKLPNMTGTQGPFSTKFNTTPSGTVTCGVCGAVRFYRFIKQARKFNIYSCESCRKFIAKMIKRQACGNQNVQTTLVCNKGQGSCQVSSIVRTQQWKLTKCAYRARCPACWLKMCLRAFHMPPSLKQSLSLMLPKNMQGLDAVYSNMMPSLLWQNNVEPKLVLDKPQETRTIKQRPLRFRNSKAPPVPNQLVSNLTNSDIKRQKIDLKGPRVKHVCRSASIVLGQPIATFSDGDKKCDSPNRTSSDAKTAEERTVVDKSVVESKCTVVNKSDVPFSENESSSNEKVAKTLSVSSESIESSTKRSYRNCSISSQISETIATERKNNLIEPTHGIYVDFWEGTSDVTNQNGFFLIGSENFPMASVCFLCGSAGKESLIFCSLCCESYHRFCLDQTKSTLLSLNRKNWKQYNWICPKCVSCDKCNQMDRQKITCQKCLKSFHPECLSLKWDRDNKQLVCPDCLKCRNCNADHATYSVGNLLLCETCFKQRRKGNACPICRHSYEENENDVKVMECTKCLKWTHPQCEKLSEEQYQIYSFLPETVQYVCSCCSEKSLLDWKKLINSELKSRLNDVLKALTKNKAAKNLLNLGISNNYRDLDFDNNNYSRDIMYMNRIYSFDENEDSLTNNTANTLSVIDIKNKLNTAEYNSVKKFNVDVEEYLKKFRSEQLLKIYQEIFQEQFPWYDNSVENERIIEEDSFETFDYYFPGDVYDEILPLSSEDTRTCGFCKNTGDGDSCKESRLLYCGYNEWVHANCALWSSDVYEEISGSLMNVHIALTKARLNRCTICKQKGATMGCSYKGCHETYHFNCGREAKLNFLYDKTVYCPSHELTRKSQLITDDKYFVVQRSIFVEHDSKNRKIVEKDNVNCMIGSLHIKHLGKIDPIASDHADALIPMGFMCTRLFWSTVEPSKLVPYTVSTSLLNPSNSMLAVDRNFTINHTLSKYAVDKMIREVNAWQRELDKKVSDTESEDDEEQQNGTELLSPELTDAILEELPHDLLDGISVQDIFPKFSYDDLISSIDCRSDIDSITDGFKRSEFEEELDQEAKFGKDQKRNKPDFYSGKIETITKSRQTQRSCGLALNYKIDSAISPVKKRKIGVGRENNLSIYQLLQVDGNCDDTSSSECGSPTGHTQDLSWENYVSEEPVTCEKCRCTYRTQASYKRHLDSCEVLCTSESDSEIVTDHDLVTYVNPTNGIDNSSEPVVISSYQSYQSEIHTSVLNTQGYISSKQTSELLGSSQNNELVIQQPLQQVIEQKPLLQTIPVNAITPVTVETSNSEPSFSVNQPTITITDSSISIATNQPQFCVNQSMPLCVNQPISLSQNSIQMNPTTTFDGNQLLSINPSCSISINPINHSTNTITMTQPVQQSLDFQPTSTVTIQSVPINNINNAILNVAPQNTFSLGGKVITNPVIQAVNMPNTHWVKQVNKPTVITQKNVKGRARGRTIAAKRTNHFEDGDALILPAQNSTGQIIVQQIPSTNYVPTFVDAFQQPNQNVQYVATITPQTVPAQSLVQIQPDNNIISFVQGLPQTMYIQQPRVVENQLVLDNNSALGWSQQQTVQPVYYGFETIVQNTVMQSQQFLPTTVPGVLTANSSYSTTTQVFQTSKLEPVLDVASNSFVLVNPNQITQPVVNSQTLVNHPQQIVNPQNIVNSQQIVNPSTIINTQPIVNSQTLVNTQPLINTQSIVNAQPIVNTQSLVNNQPMVNSHCYTQPIINSQSILHPQVVTSQPATQTIVNTQPMITAQSEMNPHSLEQFHYTQTHNTHQLQNNTKPPQLQLGIKTSPKIEVKPSQPYLEVKISQPNIEVKPLHKNIDSRSQIHYEIKVPHQQYEPMKHSHTKYSPSTTSQNKPLPQMSHSINLPTTPFVPELGIPTNIVTPIPKPPTSTQNRPMNRVLPMPTINSIKDTRKSIEEDEKAFLMDKHKISSHIFAEEMKRQPMRHISKANVLKEIDIRKLELTDPNILKTVFTLPIKPALTPPIKPALTPPIKPALTPPIKPAPTLPIKPAPTPPIKPSVTPAIKPSSTPPIKPASTPPIKPAPTPPIKPSVTPPIKPPQRQIEPTPLLSCQKPAGGNLLSPVSQPMKSPGLLSPINQPRKSPSLPSPVNQPMKSPVVLQTKQPLELQFPMNQPIMSPDLQSPMSQSINSPGWQSQINQRNMSPKVQSPMNPAIMSPGLHSAINNAIISTGLRSPMNQPMASPGLHSPMNQSMASSGLHSPMNQPMASPGLQSSMNQPMGSPCLQSPMNQPMGSPGLHSSMNQAMGSPCLQSPMNQPIASPSLQPQMNQPLKSPCSLTTMNPPGLLSPVTQPVKSPALLLLSPTSQLSQKLPNVVPPESMPSGTIQSLSSPVPEIKSPIMYSVSAVQPERTEILLDKTITPPKRLKESKKEEKLVTLEEPVQKIQKIENIPDDKPLPSKDEAVEKVVELSIPDDPKVDTSLKLVFQKQGQDGTYKVSNTFTPRPPVQVAPLKPIKSQNSVLNSKPATVTRNNSIERLRCEDKTEKREPETTKQQPKKDCESSSSILYTIETQDGFKYSSTSISDLWSKVIQAVQSARAAHNMPLLPLKGNHVMNSVQVLGLKSNGLKYLIEQLPGATKCSKYKSKYKFPPHPSEVDDEFSSDHHLHGTIRCSPYENKRTEPYDMFGWLASKHRQPAEVSLDTLELLPRRVNNLPMAMKFRQLKLTSKYSLGVYRSLIHGRGLFCLRDIEAGEMVIEYAGEVIRSILTDKREKYYNSKGIGCYMFRVDDNCVVDATMKGNAARFINHSCDPNCYSRVVEIHGHKHIIIFALRRILSGEELTYDYKFPFEEDKIPCTCGSRKCRKFLN